MIFSSSIRKVLNESFITQVKSLWDVKIREEEKLRNLPRYSSGNFNISDYNFDFSDSASFLSMRDHIWVQKNYFFRADNDEPYIIDCGSNIGLSVIYFKHLYPNSKIIAFEPDKLLYNILQRNITVNKSSNVTTYQKAISHKIGFLGFQSDGADGGRVSQNQRSHQVEAVVLSDFIDKKVDLLKIDIEGNELKVLQTCSEKLHLVKYLFLEYHSFKDKDQQLGFILRLLEDCGFRYWLNSENHVESPFVHSHKSDLDLQVNIYAQNLKI